jgi:hypothetical protein
MLLAVVDDALRERWSDAGEQIQLRGRRTIDIDDDGAVCLRCGSLFRARRVARATWPCA